MVMTNSDLILQIRISLMHVEPPIWRRVLVPCDMNLARLHDVIQVAMGWYDCHLYEFQIGGRSYGVPAPEFEDPDFKLYHATNLKLEAVLRRGIERFSYTYDFGDNWQHEVVIEQQLPSAASMDYPAFVEGEHRCPPEDVGGVPGFFEFLHTITDPAHEEHERMLEWIGGRYDPDELDVYRINLGMENIARRRRSGPRRQRT
jgi:hypothetical protein